MGWRYNFYMMGFLTFLMFVFRFIVFDLQESSKYLIAQQRGVEAVQVLEHIAKRNGKTISLRVEHLLQINATPNRETVSRTTWQVLRPSFSLCIIVF